MKKNIGTVLALSVIVIFAIGIGILSRTARQQDEMLAGLQKEKMELDGLRAENEKLKTIQVDAAELIRLRQENAGLPKLRNEVWQLREAMQPQDPQKAEAIRRLAGENEQLQQQKQELQELPDRATCIKNLEMIDAAKRQLAEKNGLQEGDRITMDDLAPFFPDGIPVCPDGGQYTVNRIGDPPVCSISGHSFP
jgi:hypothetical protein